MGLASSRQDSLPDFIDDPKIRAVVMASWTHANVLKNKNNNLQGKKQTATLSHGLLLKAGDFIVDYFKENPLDDGMHVLEIMGGNLCAGITIMGHFSNLDKFFNTCYGTDTWISTDIY